VALQVPVQAGNTLGFVCSCRAERLPAHKTAVIKIAMDAFLRAFILMVISFRDRKIEPLAFYFFNRIALPLSCNEPAYA
jgi:hypothetical protein